MATGVAQSDLVALVGPLWSVSVEEQFYVAFPFLFALCIFLFKKWGKKVACIFGILAMLVLLISLYQRYVHSEDWNYISYATVSVLPSLFLGMMLAVGVSIEKWKDRLGLWVRGNSRFLKLTAFGFFLLSLYIKFEQALGVSIYIVVLFVSTMSMILLSLYLPVEEKVTKLQSASRYLGRISYGLYAYHMFAIVGIKHLFDSFDTNNGTLPVLYMQAILIFGVTILLAHLSYRYVEKLFLRLK
jgi:peptidoglycan/LPS O-acetylase OafA/YrhL